MFDGKGALVTQRLSIVGIVVVATTVLLGGCSQPGLGLDSEGEYFAGLDRAAVDEVLSDQRRTGVLRDVFDRGDEREAMAQAMVISNDFCRATYRFYQEWISTGLQPSYPEHAVPTYPEQTYQAFLDGEYAATIKDIESGDPERLRYRLAEIDGGCGQFSPVVVGDLDGPSISEALGGRSRAESWGDD